MQIGLIGLGKMGYNLALNLRDHQHEVVAFDISAETMEAISKEGVATAPSIGELTQQLQGRKVVWVMVPAGAPTDAVLKELAPYLAMGDIVIDGGNSKDRKSVV